MRILGINQTQNLKHINFNGNESKKLHINSGTDEFVRSTGSLNITKLKEMDIAYFRLIDSNSVRGITLSDKKTDVLKKLKHNVVGLTPGLSWMPKVIKSKQGKKVICY